MLISQIIGTTGFTELELINTSFNKLYSYIIYISTVMFAVAATSSTSTYILVRGFAQAIIRIHKHTLKVSSESICNIFIIIQTFYIYA